ncbi:MAG: superoxide dismutase family protein [Planctomycetaceae bacterium]|nr:superoxide dismutase family protein [Planctomycetaceae bacterium]
MKSPIPVAAIVAALALFAAVPAFAASTTVEMHRATLQGAGEKIGTVTIDETKYGLVFTPKLTGLRTGGHGFYIHKNPDCGPGPDANTGQTIPAGAAGPHYDPQNAGRHGHPWEDNAHLGDLPLLYATPDGTATTPVLAPRLKSLADIRGRSLMIHEGGDNYSDHPEANGGGGGRMSCGVIR